MSLVAYASSDESEPDEPEPEPEEEDVAAPTPGPTLGGLFASLPAPKGPAMLPPPPQMLAPAFPPPLLLPPPTGDPRLQPPPPLPFGLGGFPPPPGVNPAEAVGVGEALGLQSSQSPGLSLPAAVGVVGPPLGLPKPKKRTEPVRIAAPELHKGDSDSEEDEPAKKKIVPQGSGEGTGLSALLPQPKNLTVKETNRLLLPHAFSRKPSDVSSDAKPSRLASKTKLSSLAPFVGTTTTTPSPSAIKAAAKSAALQVTKQITQEDDDSDEEVAPENFFSLPDKAEPPRVEPYPYPVPTIPEELPPGTEPEPAFQDDAANAPLEFKMAAGSSGAPWMPKPGDDYSYNQFSTYGDANAAGAYYQDYYSGGYYPAQDPALVPPQEIAPDASFIDDEAFKRLQGKRNRGREEINFVEIKGDDQLSGAQQWMTKSLTEEKTMKSFSKKKGEQPTGQQRRKHQITYLIHQAKERELELKNTWSENKLSRRQTQAKYGF
ncbi:proline-rich protein PRCC [Nannospalax galili]|uniref:Papillary renal cell carcinoma (translocation-associated) n=1 Tax=Nannospalax galili TaxID=1026970 RepID=A0A8C6RGC9_NANGA|nr:proline-rich protein PRCC [Nannospalax galili]